MAGLGLLEPFHNIVNRVGHNTDAIVSSYAVQEAVWSEDGLPPGFFTSMAQNRPSGEQAIMSAMPSRRTAGVYNAQSLVSRSRHCGA